MHTNHSGELSLEFLLRRGLEYIQQGNLDGGATLLTLIWEQLASVQGHLFVELDTFRQEYTNYRQAQYAFQEASVHFARAYTELQGKLANLTTVTSTLLNSIDTFHQSLPLNDEREPSLPHQIAPKQPATASPSSELSIARDSSGLLPLFITCLGPFEVRQRETALPHCSSRSGQRVLRYLVAQPEHSATTDVLQTLLWPDDEPEVAQRKLHSAISALRRALNQGQTSEPGDGYILYKQRTYVLNPAATIRTDVDEFLQLYQTGKQGNKERVACYERACQLYSRPFLMEDIYEDWSSFQREQLSRMYLTMCQELGEHYFALQRYEDAIRWATAILKQNRCDETAHRLLMQIYARQGRRSEALQQYQRCKRALYEELSVQPLPETTHLFQMLHTSGDIAPDTEKMEPAYRKNTELHATLERTNGEKEK